MIDCIIKGKTVQYNTIQYSYCITQIYETLVNNILQLFSPIIDQKYYGLYYDVVKVVKGNSTCVE